MSKYWRSLTISSCF